MKKYPPQPKKYWLKHFKQWERSGLSQIEYCRLNNIPNCENPHIKIDNNYVENKIRPFTIGRKNWIFNGSPRGANASATFYSLIETAKANNLEAYWYLKYAFSKLPYCETEEDYKKLLPYNLNMDVIMKNFAKN